MITELRLKNFKCFEKLELRIAHLTLLAGLNGMGKSSVIQFASGKSARMASLRVL